MPASSVPFTRLQNLRRRHLRRSILSEGKSAVGRSLRLNMKARKQNNNSPDENFDSNAPANASPNFTTASRVGSRHMSARAHMASNEKSAIAISVSTRGPNVRNVGVVTYAARHNNPPHSPPIR